jgi:error-prone DNA polymerase
LFYRTHVRYDAFVSSAPGYAELHSWSNFTFLEGASHPEGLVERARELGLAALALTDRDGLYGAVRFSKAAQAANLEAICGAELTLDAPELRPPGRRALTPPELARFPRIVLLVEDATGYANLCRAISNAQLRGRKHDARLMLSDLEGKTSGLIALSSAHHGYAEAALLRDDLATAAQRATALRDLFCGNFFLELQHHLRPQDARLIHAQLELAQRLGIPYVATNGAAYAFADDACLSDIVTCIKYRTTLDRAGTLLRPNHEFYLKSPAQMARIFAPYPQAITQTLSIARRCTFRLQKITGEFPVFPIPPQEQSVNTYLRTLVNAGARERYGDPPPLNVQRQLDTELGVIERMDLAGYFLIVWDIAHAAQRLGILAQGRGSAANSAVCYALGITAIDPVGMNLLFERFLSEERDGVPDIDIDFAHQDREKIIQYVYTRYGRTHAALTAEIITYRTRSAIRDVGKALGLSIAQVDAIASEYDARESLAQALDVPEPTAPLDLPESIRRRRDLDNASNTRASRGHNTPKFEEAHESLQSRSPQSIDVEVSHRLSAQHRSSKTVDELLLTFCRRIDSFPRHMGIHTGGMVITHSPLLEVAPIEWATMRDRTIVQWDKDDLSDLGLIKIDLLGLGMLSLLREAFTLFRRRYPERPPLSLVTIPSDDKPTYEMMQRADTIGVFQIESRAQQSMLPRLKPACFYDIVIQVAIIRPGPIQGDMIHPFLRRRNKLEAVTYPHPKLKPVLERTLGVPLFQEQGMRMAVETAGFSAGEADQLRRAMGHKRSHERMAQIYPRLMDGMVRNGIERDVAEHLYHMLQGFADYGFPESHAASFALLSYASAYVKCNEPAVFLAAILNVQPMGFYSTEVLVNDARRHDVVVKPVEVNVSEWWSFVDGEGAVRLGFHLVHGLGEKQRTGLEAALAGGSFDDIADFARRTQLSKEVLENLAIAGAFAPWFATRREAMWALRGLDEREARGELGRAMEIEDEPAAPLPQLTPLEHTRFDLWGLGLTTNLQPIAHFRAKLDSHGVISAKRLRAMPNHLVCKVGGMVITRQRPGTAKGFVFLTLEDETGLVNVIVNPQIYERDRRLIRRSSALIIEGILQKEQGCLDVLARRFWPLDTQGITDQIHARNFH